MIATATEIEYFIETYQIKHVSNAAIRLGVTQPTLTQSLQKLEEKLETKLFIRTKRGLIPTDAGNIFYSRAKALLENWEGIQADVGKIKSEISGKFKLGCHTAVGSYAIPPLLKKLNEAAPDIELELVHDFSRKITERLISYEIDLAYVVNPVRHPDLILTKVAEDRVTFWKKKGTGSIPKRIISDKNIVQTESLLRNSKLKVFRDWQMLQSSSLELIRTMTLNGHGVGILPERVARADSSNLVLFDERLPVYHDEIYLAYRREMLMTSAGKTLIKMAKTDL